jgi:hypothetical protein
MRPKGQWVYQSEPNPVLQEAEQHQKELDELRRKKAEARANRPVPNYICYPEVWSGRVDEHGDWLEGVSRAPTKCRRCQHYLGGPKDNHQCAGFVPQYQTLDEEERESICEYMNTAEGYVDEDDDYIDPRNPEPDFSKLRHEAATSETYDQVVMEGMTEEEWLVRKFGFDPR